MPAELTAVELIALATKHRATFVQRPDGQWEALAWERGRKLPMVGFISDSQEESARMYLRYFHHLK